MTEQTQTTNTETNPQGDQSQTQGGIPEKGTPEYNAYMVNLYESQFGKIEPVAPRQETPNVQPMPEGGQDKFYNKKTGAYDWANHVKELNYRLEQSRKPQTQTPNAQPQEQTPNGEEPKSQEQQAVENAGLDWDAITDKVTKTGKVEEADYEALAKAGIPKHVVDNYLQAFEIAKQAAQNAVIEYAGGDAALNDLIGWAAQSLTPQEKQDYNNLLASENWQVAIDALKARRQSGRKTANDPHLISGGTPSGSEAGFSSEAEMVKAIRDPRYKSDPAYREMTRRRVAMSDFNPTQGFKL